MRRWTWMAVIATLWAALLPRPAAAQTSEAVGVVTTLDGRATVARPALPGPLALKFKDDVFGRDRISTEERSLVRVLLGGKAILTVRELSQITISEEPGSTSSEIFSRVSAGISMRSSASVAATTSVGMLGTEALRGWRFMPLLFSGSPGWRPAMGIF